MSNILGLAKQWHWVSRILMMMTVGVFLGSCATQRHFGTQDVGLDPKLWFDAQADWSVKARMAVSDGQQGGQLALTWRAEAESNDIRLRSGLAGPRWRLIYDQVSASLEGSEIMPWRGAKPQELVFQATGWPVPVEAMRHWLQGQASPEATAVARDASGQLQSLQSSGWSIEFIDHQAFPVSSGGFVVLPSRLELANPPYRIRVVVESWDW